MAKSRPRNAWSETPGSNMAGVRKALREIARQGALNWAAQHPGYTVEAFSGKKGRSTGTPNHPAGTAVDFQIRDPAGNALPRRANAQTFRMYESVAQEMRRVQKAQYPELNKSFRFGGYFKQGVAFDQMHVDLDIGKKGMAYGDWEHGLNKAGRARLKGAESVGMADLPASTQVAADTLTGTGAEAAGYADVPTPTARPDIGGLRATNVARAASTPLGGLHQSSINPSRVSTGLMRTGPVQASIDPGRVDVAQTGLMGPAQPREMPGPMPGMERANSFSRFGPTLANPSRNTFSREPAATRASPMAERFGPNSAPAKVEGILGTPSGTTADLTRSFDPGRMGSLPNDIYTPETSTRTAGLPGTAPTPTSRPGGLLSDTAPTPMSRPDLTPEEHATMADASKQFDATNPTAPRDISEDPSVTGTEEPGTPGVDSSTMNGPFPEAPAAPPEATPNQDLALGVLKGAGLGFLKGGVLGGLLGGADAGISGYMSRQPSAIDAAMANRRSVGTGLRGIASAMGGSYGDTGYSSSNPGMSFTSTATGPNNQGAGLRRSDKYGWTEVVAPDGSTTGIRYDNPDKKGLFGKISGYFEGKYGGRRSAEGISPAASRAMAGGRVTGLY